MEKSEDTSRLYVRVASDLARQIANGRFAVGERLPSERNLAETYSVSRPTIREALIALELDGLVEVRMASGVYVRATHPTGGRWSEADMGPFELVEARRCIEGESCALAATRITDEQLAELDALVAEMQKARDVKAAEDADRRFHVLIAQATQNSAMAAAVTMLWDARSRSPQYQLLAHKAHAAGVEPSIEEHAAIVQALRSHKVKRARTAMHDHLTRVLESLLQATEVHELEQAKARVNAHRKKYATA